MERRRIRQKRRIFFYMLVGIFFISAPVILALAFGYRLDWVSGTVEKTGGIFIKSKTPLLSIFLNSIFQKETSLLSGGALLTEVRPGTYLLRIEKKDFHPWSKTVDVKSELVTELRDIILISSPLFIATSSTEEIALLSSPAQKTYSINKKNNLVEKTSAGVLVLAKNVEAFEVVNDNIFFVDKNGFLAKIDVSTKQVATLSRPGFFLGEGTWSFGSSPSDQLAIIDPSGGLFLVNPDGVISPVEGGVKKVYFDEEGEKLLILKERELQMLWLADNPEQPFQKSGTKEQVLSLDSRISDARWLYEDNAHMVIRSRDGIFLTELDGRGGRNTVELLSRPVDEIRTIPQISDTIFYKLGKNWFKIEI